LESGKKEKTMSRFKQIKHPDNPELKALYKEAMEGGFVGSEEGVPINFFTSQSERPDILSATLNLLSKIVVQGLLPSTVKQMVAMTIAMQNDCRYCTRLHTNALEAMGVPQGVIQSCASDPDLAELPPPQRGIVKFGLKTSRDPLSVTDDDFQTLREYGLNDGEIMEVAMMAAVENFFNTWARVSRIPLDGEEEL
jgi:uncharacterized peroxidase-related enzyme